MSDSHTTTFQSIFDTYEILDILGRIDEADAAFLRGVFERWNASAEAVEQQLATALTAVREVGSRKEYLEQQLAQARALLLRSNDLLQPGFGATDDEREQHAREVRAFLAQQEP